MVSGALPDLKKSTYAAETTRTSSRGCVSAGILSHKLLTAGKSSSSRDPQWFRKSSTLRIPCGHHHISTVPKSFLCHTCAAIGQKSLSTLLICGRTSELRLCWISALEDQKGSPSMYLGIAVLALAAGTRHFPCCHVGKVRPQ